MKQTIKKSVLSLLVLVSFACQKEAVKNGLTPNISSPIAETLDLDRKKRSNAKQGFALLKNPKSSLKYPTPEISAALDAVKLEPAAIIDEMAVELASLDNFTPEMTYRLHNLFQILDKTQQLKVARIIHKTGTVSSITALLVLAKYGTSSEIDVVLEGIKRSPNGDGVGLAELLARRNDIPDIWERLAAIAKTHPGAWVGTVDLNQYYRLTNTSPPNSKPKNHFGN